MSVAKSREESTVLSNNVSDSETCYLYDNDADSFDEEINRSRLIYYNTFYDYQEAWLYNFVRQKIKVDFITFRI